MKWSYTHDELRKGKEAFLASTSFLGVITRFSSRVEPCQSATFTHKCICPNPNHKGGKESSPSFNFSEKDKTFYCFGCHIRGDLVDLLSILTGTPWHTLVKDFLDTNKIDINNINLDNSKFTQFDMDALIFRMSLESAFNIRNYLHSCKSKPYYSEECAWAERIFKKTDRRFLDPLSVTKEDVKAFFAQIDVELDRKRRERL